MLSYAGFVHSTQLWLAGVTCGLRMAIGAVIQGFSWPDLFCAYPAWGFYKALSLDSE